MKYLCVLLTATLLLLLIIRHSIVKNMYTQKADAVKNGFVLLRDEAKVHGKERKIDTPHFALRSRQEGCVLRPIKKTKKKKNETFLFVPYMNPTSLVYCSF